MAADHNRGNPSDPPATIAFDESLLGHLLKSSKLAVNDYSLVAISGPEKGRVFQLDKEIHYIGRAEWCDIVFDADLRVSNHHCMLRFDTRGLRVLDQGSLNGVFLEGQRVLDAYMSPGAKLQIGESILQLQSHETKKEIDVNYFDGSGTLVGKSHQMRKIFSLIERVAPRDLPILLTGETGTGKSHVAQAIHAQSARTKGPFIYVNCGTLSPSMIEALLFGHEKGAFTGADQQRPGYFEQADGGTLFLDEIGELPLELQPKLLDTIERQKVRRIGGTQEINVDFQLLAATNKQLSQEVKKGSFREDLYYRISVVEIELPPLRTRPEDIPLLADMILHDTRGTLPNSRFTEAAQSILQKQLWPGNVRQLKHAIESTVALADNNIIDIDDLYLPEMEMSNFENASPTHLRPTHPTALPELTDEPLPLKEVLNDTEARLIELALQKNEWNVIQTAKYLKISKAWLYERMKHYGIKRPS